MNAMNAMNACCTRLTSLYSGGCHSCVRCDRRICGKKSFTICVLHANRSTISVFRKSILEIDAKIIAFSALHVLFFRPADLASVFVARAKGCKKMCIV